MTGQRHIIVKQCILGLFIVLIGGLTINRAIFTHAHVMPDGSIVSHAHPFQKGEASETGQGHHHNSVDFLLLDQLGKCIIVALAGSLLLLTRPVQQMRPHTAPLNPSPCITLPAGRAPPCI